MWILGIVVFNFRNSAFSICNRNIVVGLLLFYLNVCIPNAWAFESNWANNSASLSVNYSHQDKFYIRIKYSLSVSPIEDNRLLWQLTDAELLEIEFEDGESSIPDEWQPFFVILPDVVTNYDGYTLERPDFKRIVAHMAKKFQLEDKAADELEAASKSPDFTFFLIARMSRLIGAALFPIHSENPSVGKEKQISRNYRVKNITTEALESISVLHNASGSRTVSRTLAFLDDNFNQYLSAELNYDVKDIKLEESKRTFELAVEYEEGDGFPIKAVRRNSVKYTLPDELVNNEIIETYSYSR